MNVHVKHNCELLININKINKHAERYWPQRDISLFLFSRYSGNFVQNPDSQNIKRP